jgi:hypothetical protein
MNAANIDANDPLEPIAELTEQGAPRDGHDGDPGRPIEVLLSNNTVRIHELMIERPAIAAYLDQIAPDKQEIALVHALDVGVTELVARRERFKK